MKKIPLRQHVYYWRYCLDVYLERSDLRLESRLEEPADALGIPYHARCMECG